MVLEWIFIFSFSKNREDFFFFFLISHNRFFAILISEGLDYPMAVICFENNAVNFKFRMLTLKSYMKKFVNNK